MQLSQQRVTVYAVHDLHVNVWKKMGSLLLLFLFTSMHLHLIPDSDVIFSIHDLVW